MAGSRIGWEDERTVNGSGRRCRAGLPGIAALRLEDLYCDVDEFCRLFLPAWHRQRLTSGERTRRRASRLTLGEIMTILIYFHQSQ